MSPYRSDASDRRSLASQPCPWSDSWDLTNDSDGIWRKQDPHVAAGEHWSCRSRLPHLPGHAVGQAGVFSTGARIEHSVNPGLQLIGLAAKALRIGHKTTRFGSDHEQDLLADRRWLLMQPVPSELGGWYFDLAFRCHKNALTSVVGMASDFRLKEVGLTNKLGGIPIRRVLIDGDRVGQLLDTAISHYGYTCAQPESFDLIMRHVYGGKSEFAM